MSPLGTVRFKDGRVATMQELDAIARGFSYPSAVAMEQALREGEARRARKLAEHSPEPNEMPTTKRSRAIEADSANIRSPSLKRRRTSHFTHSPPSALYNDAAESLRSRAAGSPVDK